VRECCSFFHVYFNSTKENFNALFSTVLSLLHFFLPVLHMLLEAVLSQFMSIDVLLLLAVSGGRLRSV
jgi:hypothetical protein